VYCPVTRLHGFRKPYEPDEEDRWRQFDKPMASGGANEIWSFGPEVYGMLRECVLTRERLRPYVAAQMARAHERGTPVMRPLFYDYPLDQHAWDVENQYLFGPDLVVAPILELDVRSRAVYLPPSTRWIDVKSLETYDGGQTVQVEAALDRIPVFARNESQVAALFGIGNGFPS
jgi:alpha-D-xyloside xylohydrolase